MRHLHGGGCWGGCWGGGVGTAAWRAPHAGTFQQPGGRSRQRPSPLRHLRQRLLRLPPRSPWAARRAARWAAATAGTRTASSAWWRRSRPRKSEACTAPSAAAGAAAVTPGAPPRTLLTTSLCWPRPQVPHVPQVDAGATDTQGVYQLLVTRRACVLAALARHCSPAQPRPSPVQGPCPPVYTAPALPGSLALCRAWLVQSTPAARPHLLKSLHASVTCGQPLGTVTLPLRMRQPAAACPPRQRTPGCVCCTPPCVRSACGNGSSVTSCVLASRGRSHRRRSA